MRPPHDPDSVIGSERPRALRRGPSLLLVACTLILAGIVLGACGSTGPSAILNTKTVERAIERSSLAQRAVHTRARCPSAVPQRKGLVFFCTATVGRSSTRFVVTELDGSGHVRYEAP
jgi:hypothetical protein